MTDIRGRVETFVATHPDASVIDVLARLGIDPEHRDVVEEVLGRDRNRADRPDAATDDAESGTSGSPDTETDSPVEGRSRDANPGCGAVGSPPRETDDGRGPDYSEVVERSWPAGVRDRAHWMPTDEKMPFAKYADHPAIDYYRDPACEVTDSDPRRSWSDPSNWRDFETVDEWVQMDPTLAGRAFIMQREGEPYARSGETDPYLFIDGDKIRDPDTGEVIPEFPAAVDRLTGGEPTFQEISSSDTGAHALVEGRLPDGTRTKYIKLCDEPVFGHDEPPMLELYEGPKVAVLTGRRVAGTPAEIVPVDPDGLDHLLDRGTDAHPNVLAAAAKRSGTGEGGEDESSHAPSIEARSTALPDEAPTDLPACYERALRARYGDPEAVEGVRMNAHGVNLIASNLAVHAGYDVETAVSHFETYPPAAGSFDRSITKKSLAGTRKKAEKDDLYPPTLETLREVGLFDDGEACSPDCPIHGSNHIDSGEDSEGEDVEPVSLLPFAQLDTLAPDERRRAARKRGLEWPSTDDLRDRLRERVHDAVRDGEDVVLPAPTSSGKSFTVATEQWRDRNDVTDDSPVIHLHETREARDSAVEDTDDHGGEGAVIRGRSEACPVARGDHDPDDEGNENGRVVTIDGQPASAWLDTQCDEKGVPFSAAHAYLDEHNDQRAPLPCCPPVDDSPDAPRQLCPAVSQWQGVPRKENELVDYGRCNERVRQSGVFGKCGAKAGTTGKRCQNAAIDESGRCGSHGGEPVSRQCQNDAVDESGKCATHGGERGSDEGETEPSYDVVHATHPFAHVPGLVRDSTVVVDEQPDFTVELGQDRTRRAIAAYLDEIGAPVSTFEAFVSLARLGDGAWRTDAGNEADALASALASSSPAREWYLTDPDAHTLAPAIARAIWYALRDDDGPDSNERYSATVSHEPPRLDAGAHDEADWNREWVSVVVDEQNDVRRIRATPDLSGARCVIGLDAHPTPSLWQLNTRPNIQVDPLLDTDERRLWRRFERGLSVIQVGDDTRPAGKDGKYAKRDRGREPFVRHLREHFGSEFATAITDSHSETQLRSLLEQAGVDPEAIGTMHFGEERSRNDFAGESVGAVLGCIDAGDDYVLDALAELGLDASPETDVDDEGEEFRAYGREFVGTDADTAAALVASVRETHVAQAAGRYARNADDPDDTGTVFVRTDAIPVGFADYRVAGVEHVAGEKQRAVAEAAREHPGATARDLREHATDRLPGDETVSKSHVSQTLAAFLERGVIQRRQGAGAYGGDTWHADGLGDADVAGDVDLGELRDRVLSLWDTLEYQYAIRDLGVASKPSSLGDGWDAPATEPADGGDRTLHDG